MYMYITHTFTSNRDTKVLRPERQTAKLQIPHCLSTVVYGFYLMVNRLRIGRYHVHTGCCCYSLNLLSVLMFLKHVVRETVIKSSSSFAGTVPGFSENFQSYHFPSTYQWARYKSGTTTEWKDTIKFLELLCIYICNSPEVSTCCRWSSHEQIKMVCTDIYIFCAIQTSYN